MIRVTKKREKRRVRSIERRRRRCFPDDRPKSKKPKRRVAPVRLSAPRAFTLKGQDDRRRLLRLLKSIRTTVVDAGYPVLIDFSNTVKMFPDGTLLFHAEMERLRRLAKRRMKVFVVFPRDRVVEQVLQHLGTLDILGVKSRLDPDGFASNVKHWRAASGDEAQGRAAGSILENYHGRLAGALFSGLYKSITEAMTNCRQHAYRGDRGDGLPSKMSMRCQSWWMFSQEKDGELTVVFCDLGIGIPASLRDSTQWDPTLIRRLLGGPGPGEKDSALIGCALELHKTRTGERNRGKGLKDIFEVVESSPNGYLGIASNRGVLTYNSQRGYGSRIDYRWSIHGTLIEWTVPLQEAANDAINPT